MLESIVQVATMSLILLRPLLPLLLLFVINLPSSWSLCDLSASRRDEQSGAARKLSTTARHVKMIAYRGAKQAHVKMRAVEEAYSQVSVHLSFFSSLFPVYSLVFMLQFQLL